MIFLQPPDHVKGNRRMAARETPTNGVACSFLFSTYIYGAANSSREMLRHAAGEKNSQIVRRRHVAEFGNDQICNGFLSDSTFYRTIQRAATLDVHDGTPKMSANLVNLQSHLSIGGIDTAPD